MAWYDRLLGRTPQVDEEKLNPAQYVISRNEGMTVDSREIVTNYKNAYEQLEIVNRAVNMIVDDVSEIPFAVGEKLVGTTIRITSAKAVTAYGSLARARFTPVWGKRGIPTCANHSARQTTTLC